MLITLKGRTSTSPKQTLRTIHSQKYGLVARKIPSYIIDSEVKYLCMQSYSSSLGDDVTKLLLASANSKTMNKQSIVEAVHEKLGGTKVAAEQAVETMIETITNSLKKGEEVSIAGLGIFSVKTRAARTARNPRTGEAIKVAAMRVPKFRAAKALKEAVR